MGRIIDGAAVAGKLKLKLKKEVEKLKEKNINVCLVVILVGNDPASKIYVRNKQKVCEELGIVSKKVLLDEGVEQKKLLETIKMLNEDENVNGILLQMPIPKHLDEDKIINYIDPLKDVDCFNSKNVGRLFSEKFFFVPCTPAGIVELIKSTNVDVEGKSCVIIGRSNIVGKPMSILMLQNNATVTVCHSKTLDLKFFTKNADFLIVAVGKANFIKADMVKKGAVVIDVGINRLSNGGLVGDVFFEEVVDVADYITPVPGGVGPMTITKLMENVIMAAKIQNEIVGLN